MSDKGKVMVGTRGSILAVLAAPLLVGSLATPASASICEAALIYRNAGAVASCSAYASTLVFVGVTGVTDVHIVCNSTETHVVVGTTVFTANPSTPCTATVTLTALTTGTTSYAMMY
jgi:hypothetical protein